MVGSFSRILLLFAVFHAVGSLSFGQGKPCPEFDEAFVSCEFFPNEPSRRYSLIEPSRRYYLLIDERDFAPYKLNSIFHYFATKYSDIPEFKVKVFSTIEGLRAEILFDQGMPWISDKEAYDRYFEKITPPHKGYFWAIFERKKDNEKDYFRYNPRKEFDNFSMTGIVDRDSFKSPQELLFYAAIYGDMRNIAEIIQNVPDVNVRDSRDVSALAYALGYHHNEIAKLLIERGGDINMRFEGDDTLLHSTIFENNYAGVKLLIQHGVDLRVLTEPGNRLLWAAIWTCNIEMVKLLIDNGATTDNLLPLCATGIESLTYCKNEKEVLKLLLKKTAP